MLSVLDRVTRRSFELTGKKRGEVSLLVCDDRFISELNRTYRNKPEPTDVLSFSMREGENSDIEDSTLGDIIISVDTAARQAREAGISQEEEFIQLYTHGLLHLLGFTHDGTENGKLMQSLTREILAGVH
jgi:probable rRNA maturation factor